MGDMKITELQAHFHPFVVGAPRPEAAHAAIDMFAEKYAEALFNHGKDTALLDLFAPTGDISWTDPVGTPPHAGREAIEERIKNLPDMDFAKVAEIFYTISDKIFLVKVEMKFTGKPNSFFIVDKIVVDDDMKITELQAHFHPFVVGAPRPEAAHAAIDVFAEKYAEALFNHGKDTALLDLFAPTGDISWTDPVGTPPHAGREAIEERIKNLPDMDFAKVAEIFYTISDKIFLVKVEMKFTGKPNSFFIVDKIVIA